MKSAMTATETPICSPRARSFSSLIDHGRPISASIIAITSARLPSGRALSQGLPLLRWRRGRFLPRTPFGRQTLPACAQSCSTFSRTITMTTNISDPKDAERAKKAWKRLHKEVEGRILGVICTAATEVICKAPRSPMMEDIDAAYLAVLNVARFAVEGAIANVAGYETWAALEAALVDREDFDDEEDARAMVNGGQHIDDIAWLAGVRPAARNLLDEVALWTFPLKRARGRIDYDGLERVTTQLLLDMLRFPSVAVEPGHAGASQGSWQIWDGRHCGSEAWPAAPIWNRFAVRSIPQRGHAPAGVEPVWRSNPVTRASGDTIGPSSEFPLRRRVNWRARSLRNVRLGCRPGMRGSAGTWLLADMRTAPINRPPPNTISAGMRNLTPSAGLGADWRIRNWLNTLVRRAATSSGWSERPAAMTLNNSSMRRAGVAGVAGSARGGAELVMAADTFASVAPLPIGTAAKAVSALRRASESDDELSWLWCRRRLRFGVWKYCMRTRGGWHFHEMCMIQGYNLLISLPASTCDKSFISSRLR